MNCTSYVGRFVATLALLMTVALTMSDHVSADANSIAVDSVSVAANQVTLVGTFGLGAASVLFGSKPLPIVSSSASQVVATLNPVPHSGTYTVALTVANKTATAFATIGPKTLGGLVFGDGSVSGTGFAVSHPFPGDYQVTFPSGTFQYGGNFPPIVVTPLFVPFAPNSPNVVYYVIYGDQSGIFIVDFAGVDTGFSFNVTQSY